MVNTRSSSNNFQQNRWRKVLYEPQNYPDNYSGTEFLEGLRKNVNCVTYDFWTAVGGTHPILQQISSILIFVAVFAFVYENWLSWKVLLGFCLFFSFIGFFAYQFLNPTDSSINFVNVLRTLIVYLGFGYGLSPVFKSLTETISTDTIYATATIMFIGNLLFHNYGIDAAIVSWSLSLNAGVFGAVCLISRLSTANHAFAVLTFGILVFALFPVFRNSILLHYPKWKKEMTATLFLIASCSLFFLDPVSFFLYLVMQTFIAFFCPAILIFLQPVKSTIHGPWDEATIPDQNG